MPSGIAINAASGVEEALSRRRRGDAHLSEVIANDGDRRRGVARRFILDDLQRPQPRAPVAAATDEEAPIRRGREQDRAGG